VLIGGRVARLRTLMAPRAPAGDRLEITMPVPDPRVIDRSFATAQPFGRKHVSSGWRTPCPRSALGGIAEVWTAVSTRGTARAGGILGQRAADVRRARQSTLMRRGSPSSPR